MEVILDEHPNHARARLFLKDMKSSMTMYYDEDQERFTEARNAILDTPVSDFELSVRSRNCLKTMNMRTLGDLLRVTEAQLMAYKNFGDTSLKEIKTMLAQKGLRLGQLLEEEPSLPSGNGEGGVSGGGIGAKSVAEMELSVRARKCLQRLGISTIGELTQRSEPELLAIKNFGQTSLQEIKRRLSEFGLSLRSNK
jgi:DNA-directed RNA polymerase subunit alpha